MHDLLNLTILFAMPLILAAMGGYTSERGGVINIGLEGMMLAGACAGALAAVHYGPVGELVAGIGAATLMSLLHWLATQVYGIDHVISGMAVNLIAAGGTNYLYQKFADEAHSNNLPHLPMSWFLVTALVLPFLLWLYTGRTRGGLRLMAVGSDPDKARLMGVQPIRVRLFGLIATGVLTGIAGVELIAYTGVFTDNMTAGRGYIALAALIVGGWRPLPAFAACLVFGFFSAVRLQLQGTPLFGAQLPSQLWAALPYIVTVIALAGLIGRNRTPAGLGKP